MLVLILCAHISGFQPKCNAIICQSSVCMISGHPRQFTTWIVAGLWRDYSSGETCMVHVWKPAVQPKKYRDACEHVWTCDMQMTNWCSCWHSELLTQQICKPLPAALRCYFACRWVVLTRQSFPGPQAVWKNDVGHGQLSNYPTISIRDQPSWSLFDPFWFILTVTWPMDIYRVKWLGDLSTADDDVKRGLEEVLCRTRV